MLLSNSQNWGYINPQSYKKNITNIFRCLQSGCSWIYIYILNRNLQSDVGLYNWGHIYCQFNIQHFNLNSSHCVFSQLDLDMILVYTTKDISTVNNIFNTTIFSHHCVFSQMDLSMMLVCTTEDISTVNTIISSQQYVY